MTSWASRNGSAVKFRTHKEAFMTKTDSYKGRPTLTLMRDAEDKYPFTFGLQKARLILDNLQAIHKFVLDNKESNGGDK